MRTTKELLILLRRALPSYIWFGHCYGLCSTIWDLHGEGVITLNEYNHLSDYLFSARPQSRSDGFWWEPGRIWPRYLFLTKLIKELK